jgi:hypothetical protein
MPKSKRYNLIYLDYRLRATGFARRCLRYELSSNKEVLHVVYLDFLLEEQFISVFRTSRRAYRVYYAGELVRKCSVKETAEYLDGLMSAIIADGEFYDVMTVSELNRLDRMEYNKRMDLYRRGRKC